MSLVLFLSAFVAFAQENISSPVPADVQVLSQQGSLFSVHLAKDKPLKIFILGKEKAELNFSTLQMQADFDPSDVSVRVRVVHDKKKGPFLRIKKENNYFVVTPIEIEKKKPFTLEIRAKVKQTEENFQFKVENKMP